VTEGVGVWDARRIGDIGSPLLLVAASPSDRRRVAF
jgi:hypothetical protein